MIVRLQVMEVTPLLGSPTPLSHNPRPDKLPLHPSPKSQSTGRVQNPRSRSYCWLQPQPPNQLLLLQHHPCPLLSGMRHLMTMKRCVRHAMWIKPDSNHLKMAVVQTPDNPLSNIGLFQVVNLSDSDDEQLPQSSFIRWNSIVDLIPDLLACLVVTLQYGKVFPGF